MNPQTTLKNLWEMGSKRDTLNEPKVKPFFLFESCDIIILSYALSNWKIKQNDRKKYFKQYPKWLKTVQSYSNRLQNDEKQNKRM